MISADVHKLHLNQADAAADQDAGSSVSQQVPAGAPRQSRPKFELLHHITLVSDGRVTSFGLGGDFGDDEGSAEPEAKDR